MRPDFVQVTLPADVDDRLARLPFQKVVEFVERDAGDTTTLDSIDLPMDSESDIAEMWARVTEAVVSRIGLDSIVLGGFEYLRGGGDTASGEEPYPGFFLQYLAYEILAYAKEL